MAVLSTWPIPSQKPLPNGGPDQYKPPINGMIQEV